MRCTQLLFLAAAGSTAYAAALDTGSLDTAFADFAAAGTELADNTSADIASAGTEFADSASVGTEFAGTALADTFADKTGSVDKAAVDKASADTLSADTLSADTLPADTLSADKLSADTLPPATTSAASIPTLEELEDAGAYLKAIESVNSKLDAFTTVKGFAALETDYADWTKSYIAAASATPSQDEMNIYLADQFDGMVKLAEQKSYMSKEAQASLVAVVGEYQTLLRDQKVVDTGLGKVGLNGTKTPSNGTAGKQLPSDYTEVSAAGRVGGIGALGAVLASGLFLVAAL